MGKMLLYNKMLVLIKLSKMQKGGLTREAKRTMHIKLPWNDSYWWGDYRQMNDRKIACVI